MEIAGSKDQPAGYAVAVSGLTHRFGAGPALFDRLDFAIATGEFVALLAPSGIGKTTLFRLLAGLLEPQAGTIAIAGTDSGAAEGAIAGIATCEAEGACAGTSAGTSAGSAIGKAVGSAGIGRKRKADAARIGYMPQRDCLLPWRNVLDNAALGLELAGASKRAAREQARQLLPEFGLAGAAERYPHELSGGMRQRVAFLRAILGGAEVLLLDEPFSALDAMTRASMQSWLLNIWGKHRKTVLFITHDVDEALLLADRVLVAAASPIASLQSFAVPFIRPRDYSVVLEPAFATLKRSVLQVLATGSGAAKEEGE